MTSRDHDEFEFDAARPWRTLAALFRPERGVLGVAAISYLIKASPVWVLPVVTANVVDALVTGGQGAPRTILVNGGVGLLFVFQNLLSAAVYVSFLSRALRSAEVRLRSALVRHLQMLSIGYHDASDNGALQTKLTRDIESVEQMSRQLVDIGFISVVTILVTWGVTAVRIPAFLPVFIVFVPVVGLIVRTFAARLRGYNEFLRRRIEEMNSAVWTMLEIMPLTRAHAVETAEIARAEAKIGGVREAARRFDFAAGVFGAASWVTVTAFNLAGLVAAAYLTSTGRLNLTAGDVVLLAGYFNAIMAAVLQLNAMLPSVARGTDALRSIGEVLEAPGIEPSGGGAVAEVRGAFVFEGVGFEYGGSGKGAALVDVSLEVAPGESVAITGPSGSGKSTLAALLIGFHRPTRGRILLDGADMNDLDLRAYRRRIAVVGQRTLLFDGTLRENITYGLARADDDEIGRAVEAANAADFIDALPAGIDTEIGTRGVRLSGGQQQRIAIARAILRDPRVLILDEATSALDAESERAVEEALARLIAGRTCFIITHKPSILRLATRVIELRAGRISAGGQIEMENKHL